MSVCGITIHPVVSSQCSLRLSPSLNSKISVTTCIFWFYPEISLVFTHCHFPSSRLYICLLTSCNSLLSGLQFQSLLTPSYFTLQATQTHQLLVWKPWMIYFCLQDKNLNFLVWLFKMLAQPLFLTESLAIHRLLWIPWNYHTQLFAPCWALCTFEHLFLSEGVSSF